MRKPQGNPDAKVIIVGDPEVGKTSILTQFDKKIFNARTENTVGAAFVACPVETTHGVVNLLIWDTAGQERYRSLIPMYSRNAAAALLVIDVSNAKSYENIEVWYNVLKDSCTSACKIYIVANKIDLECRIPIDNLKRWAKRRNHELFMTCAANYQTIEPVFRRVAEDVAGLVHDDQQDPVILSERPSSCC